MAPLITYKVWLTPLPTPLQEVKSIRKKQKKENVAIVFISAQLSGKLFVSIFLNYTKHIILQVNYNTYVGENGVRRSSCQQSY